MPSSHKNHKNLNEAERFEFLRLNNYLSSQLLDKDSELSDYLRRLSDDEKATLISALVTNNTEVIKKILDSGLSTFSNPGKYHELITIQTQDSNNSLSPLAHAMIRGLLVRHDAGVLSDIAKTRILRMAMEQIPDTSLDLKSKNSLCKEIDPKAAEGIRVSHNQPVQMIDKNLYQGDVTLEQYKAAIKSPKLTHSEFVFLTLGLIQKYSNNTEETNELMNNIRQSYLKGAQENTLSLIQTLVSQYENELDAELIEAILARSETLDSEKVDNYARRFFETRCAQLYNGKISDFESFDKISKYFIHKQVKSFSDLDAAFLSLAELPDKKLIARYEELAKNSKDYQERGRAPRSPAFMPKLHETVLGKESETALSKKLGTLKAHQPVPLDSGMLSESTFRNRGVDISAIKSGGQSYYADRREGSSFVTSISGHCFFMVATLERYMETHKDDPNLQANVNEFIKAYVMNYVGRGYHSLTEMTDPFQERQVQDIFKKYNVTVNLNWGEELLKQAFKDTQEYAKSITLQKGVHQDLTKFMEKREDAQISIPLIPEVLHKKLEALKNETVRISKIEGEYEGEFSTDEPSISALLKFFEKPLNQLTKGDVKLMNETLERIETKLSVLERFPENEETMIQEMRTLKEAVKPVVSQMALQLNSELLASIPSLKESSEEPQAPQQKERQGSQQEIHTEEKRSLPLTQAYHREALPTPFTHQTSKQVLESPQQSVDSNGSKKLK